MSLGVVVKGPEGIVLAADSRVTLMAQGPMLAHPLPVNFDNATKLISFSKPHNFVGVVTYGEALVKRRTAHSYIPEFEQLILSKHEKRLSILAYAQHLSQFFHERWNESIPESIPANYQGPGMEFVVGGYNPDEAYGEVFCFNVPNRPEPQPRNPGPNDFGVTWGGQLEIAGRLIHGFDPRLPEILRQTLTLNDQQMESVMQALRQNLEFAVPYQVLPLQDCIDLSLFLIRTTITAQALSIGIRGVGGMIDVAIITRTAPLQYVQQKNLRGERGEIERRE